MEDFLIDAECEYDDFKNLLLEVNNRDFFTSVVERGNEYYSSGKVINLTKKNDHTYEAIIKGSQDYIVTVSMKNHHCIESKCTCPFNTNLDKRYTIPPLCKHIYAVQKSIYEIENFDFIKEKFDELKEKLKQSISKQVQMGTHFDSTKEELELLKEQQNNYMELMKNIDLLISESTSLNNILNIIHRFLGASEEISFKLLDIEKAYFNRTIQKYENEDNIDIESDTSYEDNNDEKIIETPKNTFSFWKILGAILGGIFTGITSSLFSNDTNSESKSFNIGDMVWVRGTRIGIVVGIGNSKSYMIKLKDEFENEHTETFFIDELKSYY